MLSLVGAELALKPLIGDFGGRAGGGPDLEHLTPEEARGIFSGADLRRALSRPFSDFAKLSAHPTIWIEDHL